MKTALICVATVAMFCSGAQAAIVSLTTAEGNGADALVRSSLGGNNAANNNFGAADFVALKTDTALPGNNRKSYLRFDLTSVIDVVSSAELELTFTALSNDPNVPAANPSTYNVYGLRDGHPDEAWSESDITWNNAPGNNAGSTGGVVDADTTLLGTFSFSPASAVPGQKVVLGSDELAAFLNEDLDELATLIITRQDVNFAIELFASKENLDFDAPALTISSVPIPAALPLMLSAIGVAGYAAGRRRRHTAV